MLRCSVLALQMIKKFTDYLKLWRYRENRCLSRFIARDIRRDIKIVSAKRLSEGFLTVRMKTNNILYVSHDLTNEEGFGEEVEVSLDDLWTWSGKSWGGLPDGSSITGISPEDIPRKNKA